MGKMVSVLVSVLDPSAPYSLVQKQLRMEARVGIEPTTANGYMWPLVLRKGQHGMGPIIGIGNWYRHDVSVAKRKTSWSIRGRELGMPFHKFADSHYQRPLNA
jgi:hypothetical protein